MPSVPSSERPTTGRRHIRDGSVHVTELIRLRTRPCRNTRPFPAEAYPSASPEDGSLDTLLDLDGQPPSSHRRPPSPAAQVAKIVSLGVASVLLCGSILLGTMIGQRRQDDVAAARPEVDISGERALLPDVLSRAVPKSGVATGPALPGPATRATGVIENPGPAPAPAAEPSAAPAGPGPAPAVEQPLAKTDFVERFYRLIPDKPDLAFSYLDGTLLGTDLLEFKRSWSDVCDIQVETRDQGDNVLALVRLCLPDGSHLQLQQLVFVSDTVPQRITGAHILSAQRD